MQLVLASASPRRAELLRTAGFTFDVRPADVDETPWPAEPPATSALRVARDKALAAAAQVGPSGSDVWILAADTVVGAGVTVVTGTRISGGRVPPDRE